MLIELDPYVLVSLEVMSQTGKWHAKLKRSLLNGLHVADIVPEHPRQTP